MQLRTFRSSFLAPIALVVSCLTVSACGGAKGLVDEDPDATSVDLRANRSSIAPGESVTLTWSSKNADKVETSNLGVDNVNGTITVTPTFTSDYTITVRGNGTHTDTVRITVDRPRPRFAIVGNAADPEVPQIQANLQSVGDTTVTATLPAASTFDAVVIHGSGSVGTADTASVQAALNMGKGVVLVGLAPAKLATGADAFGDAQTLDTTSVASWFGGVKELKRGVGVDFDTLYATNVNLAYFALPTSIDPEKASYQGGDGDDQRLPRIDSGEVGAAAYRVLDATGFFSDESTIAFAYRPPTGGRVAWQWHSGGFNAASKGRMSDLFRSTCLWAASE